jgi:microcompartment protein CcmK/EutM
VDLARIIGTVVAERKDPALQGVQLCILQPVNERLESVGKPLIATEASRSRAIGDLVYYVASGDAVWTHPEGRALPTDAAVVGFVDGVHLSAGGNRP